LPLSFVEVKDLCKVYEGPEGGVEALRDLTFSVVLGDFVAVRGPSGCGKSTLLHILGAMERPTSGSVRLGSQELQELGLDDLAILRRRRIGFVFQEFNLFPTLTVAENVTLPLTLDGLSEATARRRAQSLLEQVGLTTRALHYPAQISGGEMQRVAVARAVAAEPEILLADEPTGNLDSENGQRVMDLLSRLNQDMNLTILLATHSDEAASFASRPIYLRDGRLSPASEEDERISTTL
jgi:putative ABC transport system ATP-binding protein